MQTTTRIARSTTPAVDAKVGDIVSYQDISNPQKFYTVIGHVRDAWGTHAQLIDHATGGMITGSLRGAGWVMAELLTTTR